MEITLTPAWHDELRDEMNQPYFTELMKRLESEYATTVVYPAVENLFAAFRECDFGDVKVVILGQDPYHGPGQAHGLSFSVPPGVQMPPSLRNILMEVSDDTGAPMPADGCLTRWARQGVLLLNSVLSVRESQPGSHASLGWQQWTDSVISLLSRKRDNLVFILWGNYAIRKASLIDASRHLILRGVHPSPLSAPRGFFGNHHFSRANDYLKVHGKTPIVW
ncbi:MAG: uracil-DNA glycosylase [Paramuribaculum sp.]|nr:uracil-DNA glycosylase [Paramuribaculum sp.]